MNQSLHAIPNAKQFLTGAKLDFLKEHIKGFQTPPHFSSREIWGPRYSGNKVARAPKRTFSSEGSAAQSLALLGHPSLELMNGHISNHRDAGKANGKASGKASRACGLGCGKQANRHA